MAGRTHRIGTGVGPRMGREPVGALDYPRRCARSRQLPPGARHHPGLPGRLPVPRSAAHGHLRRQGEEPAPAAELLLRRHRRPAPAHRADGDQRRVRRVDGGVHRGRGAAAGIQLDQGVRPAVQRPLPRRQVLPGAGRHRGRGVPAAAGDARAAQQGRPLLRPVRPRLGDPRDARPAAAGLPGPHLLGWCVPSVAADRPALPARLHRQVLGALHRPGHRRGAPRDRRRLLRFHGGQGRPDDPPVGEGDGRGGRRARLREGRPAARRPGRAAPGGGEAGGGARRRHRRRRGRHRRRRPARVRAGVPRPRRPGARPAWLDRRRGRRHRRCGRGRRRRCARRAGGELPVAVLRGPGRRRRRDRGAAGDPGAGAAGVVARRRAAAAPRATSPT